MSIDPKTLEEFDGKNVVIHLIQPDGSVAEKEGKIEAASEFGVAFKEKGKRDSDLVEPKDIEEIAVAAVKPKTLAQKKLKETTENTVRQHLLDRHGYDRSVVNGMDDDKAFAEHNDIDHADLGHKHVAEDDDDSDENAEGGESSEE